MKATEYLWNFYHLVIDLFSQMISLGSDASSNSND
jgi:hypothetical protein